MAHQSKDARKQLQDTAQLHWVHWLIISLSVVLTLFAWYFSQKQIDEKVAAQFERESSQLIHLVVERLMLYEEALWAGVAMLKTEGGETDYHTWKRYATNVNLVSKYPGINGIGIIEYISSSNLTAYLEKERKQRPNYRVHPKHDKNFYLPISYIIPLKGNEKAVGLDMAHEKNRLTAALKARESGKAQITGPIILVQDDEKTPGFLFFAPFYDEGIHSSISARERNFKGMVYAPFIVKKLMNGLLDKKNRRIDIEISDGDTVLYSDIKGSMAPITKNTYSVKSKVIYGRTWQFKLQAESGFLTVHTSSQPTTILLGGLFIDLLLLILFLSITGASKQSLQYADRVTEELREKTIILEKSNDELNQFAYATSHDLRAPLRGIEQLATWIIEDDSENLSDESKVRLAKLKKRVVRMHGLINGILEYSQLGDTNVTTSQINLNALLVEIIDGLGNPVNVKINIPKDLPTIEANATVIGQVFSNLITNAIKHNDKDFVDITIEFIDESLHYQFYIHDNGPGIDEAFHEKAFALFHTLKPKDEVESSGVGLALIKKAVEAQGGAVSIETTEGDGCTFKFTWMKNHGESV